MKYLGSRGVHLSLVVPLSRGIRERRPHPWVPVAPVVLFLAEGQADPAHLCHPYHLNWATTIILAEYH